MSVVVASVCDRSASKYKNGILVPMSSSGDELSAFASWRWRPAPKHAVELLVRVTLGLAG